MKIKGTKLGPVGRHPITLFFTDKKLVVWVKPISDESELHAVYPAPQPPTVTKRGQEPVQDFKDPRYLEAAKKYNEIHTTWMLWHSLVNATLDEAGEQPAGIEFETIKLEEPETLLNIDKELHEVMTSLTVMKVFNDIMRANAPSEKTFDESLEAFQLARQAGGQSSFLKDEPETTELGERASERESDSPELAESQ